MIFSYLSFAISFIILVYILETFLQYRQHSLYKVKTLPVEIQSLTSVEEFSKSQLYSKDKSNFTFLKEFFNLFSSLATIYYLPLLFKFSQTLSAKFASDMGNIGPNIITSLLFLYSLLILNTLLSTPFSLYYHFVVEERHGFNKQTLKLFFMDLVKSHVLTILFGGPVVTGYILLVQFAGEMFPLMVWAFFFVIKLVLYMIYPPLIQPCFNKVEPLEEGELRSKIEKLAGTVKFPLKKLYRIDGSKRSSHSNAYMYGFCNNKHIVLYDTLIEQCTKEEIEAVLCHELGHWAKSHTLKLLVMSEAYLLGTFLLLREFLFTRDLFESFGFKDANIIIGTTLFLYVYAPVSHVMSLVMNFISRKFEFQADRFSAKFGMTKELKSALLTLEKKNLSGFLFDPWYSLYHHNHPPVLQRIKALEEIESKRK